MSLQELNRTWLRCWLEKDADAVDRLMTESYFYVAANGTILDRAAMLTIIRSPSYRLERGAVSEERAIELSPTVAALVHRFQGAGTYEGRSFVDDQRCITLFLKRGNAWLFAFEQVSPIG